MKLLIIYNPQAGGGRAARWLDLIKSYLVNNRVTATIQLTKSGGHAAELAKAADLSKFDGIVASGGDGTLFEVLNGYMLNSTPFNHPALNPSKLNSSVQKPPIGLIPNGTGNAFMKELGLKKNDWQRSIDIILAKKSVPLDIGQLTTEEGSYYFINIVGMGFVSQVAQAAIPLKWMGNAAYTVATMQKLVKLKAQTVTLELDGQIIERQGVFVEVANSRYTGTRFLMAPKAKLNDGLLDVVLLKQISRLKLLRLFNSIYAGSHINYPEIDYFQAQKIKVSETHSSRLIPDGEVLGQTPAAFECIAGAVQFFWP